MTPPYQISDWMAAAIPAIPLLAPLGTITQTNGHYASQGHFKVTAHIGTNP